MLDTLYIHAGKYDVKISKSKFFEVIDFESRYLIYHEGICYKNLYAIYCYEDSIVRFTLENDINLDTGRITVEKYFEDFESKMEELIEKFFLKEKVS